MPFIIDLYSIFPFVLNLGFDFFSSTWPVAWQHPEVAKYILFFYSNEFQHVSPHNRGILEINFD